MAIRLMGCDKAVADPGFPQSEGCGGATYDFTKFSQKLHGFERIWTPGGVPCTPLDQPIQSIYF